MGQARAYQQMKLIMGIMQTPERAAQWPQLQQHLQQCFGPIDFISRGFNYTHSQYYNAEMGPQIQKHFVSFARLFSADDFYTFKLKTQQLEEYYRATKSQGLQDSQDSQTTKNFRTVNLDPGAITLYNLMLLTTKNFSHRIPLQQGIYAEVTLLYQGQGKTWLGLPWTYSDYVLPQNGQWFLQVRERLQQQKWAIGEKI